MKNSRFVFVFIVLNSIVSVAISGDREQRLMDHAYYCLTNDLIFASTGEATKRPLIDCQAAELGLAYIGERSTKVALNELANIRRYKLDGAMGESYTCYILSKGQGILKLFQRRDFHAERVKCESEVEARLLMFGVSESAPYVEAACSTPKINSEWLKEMRSAINSGRKCIAENW